MAEKVKLQNLRDFTVQIRRYTDDGQNGDKEKKETYEILGTGVVVGTYSILTCAHVVEAAIGKHPRDAGDCDIPIYFPQVKGETQKFTACVEACFSLPYEDDIALLKIKDSSAPLGAEKFARLGKAEDSQFHKFGAYGYADMEPYNARYARGDIMGHTDPPKGRTLYCDPLELNTESVMPGMSGGAVLDIDRNLIIGLIRSRWNPGQRDETANIAWATDAWAISFESFQESLAQYGIQLYTDDLPKGVGPDPKLSQQHQTAVQQVTELRQKEPRLQPHLVNAPPPLGDQWVGRADLLTAISADDTRPETLITGLIGFGGEGKSSLARKWVDMVLPSPEGTSGSRREAGGEGRGEIQGLFWWSFYEKPGVDEFFEAALKYISGEKVDTRAIPSSNARASFIIGMLTHAHLSGKGRYIFILDGFEVMQHQEGDHYGSLKNGDMREFLELFAAGRHGSFCLITSRVPVLDLMDNTTYTHRDVTRLSDSDGRDLLKNTGVKGRDEALTQVVNEWHGHALTLSLLGRYLGEFHEGNIHRKDHFALPQVTGDEPSQGSEKERRTNPQTYVTRILMRYDEHLTESERAFLMLFSAFRTPVKTEAFARVFRTETTETALNAPLVTLTDEAFEKLLQRLLNYRMLKYDKNDDAYSTHPLIRNHYSGLLMQRGDRQAAHSRIKDYYLDTAGRVPEFPTLDDLQPLIEVVYHACRAGAYDEAWDVYWGRIYQTTRRVIIHVLGAYETNLMLATQFFPDGDTSKEPQTSNPQANRFILNAIGFCLMNLGRQREAVPFYERAVAAVVKAEDWHNASAGYQNLAELHIQIGNLTAAATAASQAVDMSKKAANKRDEIWSLKYQAWTAHLKGEMDTASEAFKTAEKILEEDEPGAQYLYSQEGIFHADHLRRAGQAEYARRVTEANLEICERNRFVKSISQCHRVLGDLDSDAGQPDSARTHYDEALRIARSISFRAVLIEALLGRGRWLAKAQKAPDAARSDLAEALDYALDGEYRIYEADIRVALAWLHVHDGKPTLARQEAERAKTLSQQIGYHWGAVDADELLAHLAQ